jgi:putative tricarboxylic transport membrane protein
MRTNDAISGFVLILLASFMIYLTLSFPPFPGQNYGPALFPRILGAGLILCGAFLMIRGARARTLDQRWIEFAPWTREPWRLVSFLLLPALVLIYILVSEQIGFLIVAFAVLIVLFLWFQVKPIVALPVAVIGTWAIHYFFASLMRVPLPRGLLTNLL